MEPLMAEEKQQSRQASLTLQVMNGNELESDAPQNACSAKTAVILVIRRNVTGRYRIGREALLRVPVPLSGTTEPIACGA